MSLQSRLFASPTCGLCAVLHSEMSFLSVIPHVVLCPSAGSSNDVSTLTSPSACPAGSRRRDCLRPCRSSRAATHFTADFEFSTLSFRVWCTLISKFYVSLCVERWEWSCDENRGCKCGSVKWEVSAGVWFRLTLLYVLALWSGL